MVTTVAAAILNARDRKARRDSMTAEEYEAWCQGIRDRTKGVKKLVDKWKDEDAAEDARRRRLGR